MLQIHDFAEQFNVKQAEVLNENLDDDGTGYRLVRLSFTDFGYSGIREMIAKLGVGGVNLHKIDVNGKNKHFNLAVEQMDKLAVEWIQFRSDCLTKIELAKVEREREREGLFERAHKLGITLSVNDDNALFGEWTMTFPEGHPFNMHWRHNDDLFMNQVVERLEHMEEEMSKS